MTKSLADRNEGFQRASGTSFLPVRLTLIHNCIMVHGVALGYRGSKRSGRELGENGVLWGALPHDGGVKVSAGLEQPLFGNCKKSVAAWRLPNMSPSSGKKVTFMALARAKPCSMKPRRAIAMRSLC